MGGIRHSVRQAIGSCGLGVLQSPQRLVAFARDELEGHSPEAGMLERCCDAAFLAPYARAVGSPSAESLLGAARMAQDHLQADCLIEGQVAWDVSVQVALGVADALGVAMPEGDQIHPIATASQVVHLPVGAYLPQDARQIQGAYPFQSAYPPQGTYVPQAGSSVSTVPVSAARSRSKTPLVATLVVVAICLGAAIAFLLLSNGGDGTSSPVDTTTVEEDAPTKSDSASIESEEFSVSSADSESANVAAEENEAQPTQVTNTQTVSQQGYTGAVEPGEDKGLDATSVSASSCFDDGGAGAFGAYAAIDGSTSTAWRAHGDDEEPWIELALASERAVRGVRIHNGCVSDDGTSVLGNVRDVNIELSDGTRMHAEIGDRSDVWYEVDFGSECVVSWVRLEIASTYSDDVASAGLSEVGLYA